MRKNMKNETHIEGIVYEHNLQAKVTGDTSKNPGTPYIAGDLMVATDDAGLNVVTVHFTYVTENTASGKVNTTYQVLKKFIDGTLGTVVESGKENAAYVRIDSALALNEWYGGDDNELISVRRNEGGFVHVITEADLAPETQRATWKADMLINSVYEQEGDEERNIPDKVMVKGAIFNFRKELLPMEFSAIDEKAKNYFLGLDASQNNPVFTQIWGKQVSQTVVREITQESAFGDAEVKQVKSTRKDFTITGAAPAPYEWDAEDTILASELSEAVSARQIKLAEIKKGQEERAAAAKSAPKGVPTSTTVAGGPAKIAKPGNFNF